MNVLEFTHDTGIVVTSFTFDGAIANISMVNIVGANFRNRGNLKT